MDEDGSGPAAGLLGFSLPAQILDENHGQNLNYILKALNAERRGISSTAARWNKIRSTHGRGSLQFQHFEQKGPNHQ